MSTAPVPPVPPAPGDKKSGIPLWAVLLLVVAMGLLVFAFVPSKGTGPKDQADPKPQDKAP